MTIDNKVEGAKPMSGIGNYVRNAAVGALAGVYMLSTVGCATAPGKHQGYNFNVNGQQVYNADQQRYAESGQVANDANKPEAVKKDDHTWLYVAGAVALAIITGVVISNSGHHDNPAGSGGSGGGI